MALLILCIPLLIFSSAFIIADRKAKQDDLEVLMQGVISDFEIFLDHLNGAIINLKSSYTTCDDVFLNQVHRTIFGLPGVEAFVVFDNQQMMQCTNWLHNAKKFPLEFPDEQLMGLQLTGEEHIPYIGESGIVAYRAGSKYNLAAVISSSYLRQIVDVDIPLTDSLMLYNAAADKQLVVNGLLSANALLEIKHNLSGERPSIKSDDYQLLIVQSEHFHSVAAAYFYRPQTWLSVLNERRLELGLFIAICISLALGWLAYRHQKLNSSAYQIQQGLKHSEFTPYLQPIVDMRNGEWIGAECLTRWLRNGEVVATPDKFIVAAEESSLIKELTEQVAIKMGQVLQKHSSDLGKFYFSFNLSPNFIDQNTVDAIQHFRQSYSLFDTLNIRFEITEHGLAEINKNTFGKIIKKLSAEGYLFGLDDFGTGQSGLEYFSNLNPDFLKIDRSFVNAIDAPDSIEFQLLKTIVQLANSLDISMIAEGVETKTQRQWLVDNGIYYGQGWLFQKAIPIPEFLDKMADNEYHLELQSQLSLVSGE
jgi:sensor c-di-GMP phosphodiesterase-like protein